MRNPHGLWRLVHVPGGRLRDRLLVAQVCYSVREGDDAWYPWRAPSGQSHYRLSHGRAVQARYVAERSGKVGSAGVALRAAVWTQASDYAVTAVDHMPVRKRRRDELLTITGNHFPCGDGNWVVFNMLPDAACSGTVVTIGLQK